MRTLLSLAVVLPLMTASLAAVARAGDVTDKAYVDFATKLEKSLAARDKAVLDASLDAPALCARALANLDAPKSQKDAFAKAVGEHLPEVSGQLVRSLGKTGTVRLLRVRDANGAVAALLRVVHEDGVLGYQEIALAKAPDGTVKIADLYAYAEIESFSETLRRNFLETLVDDPPTIEKLTGKEKEYCQQFSTIKQMRSLQAVGQAKAALDAYTQLTPSLQTMKALLRYRVTLAGAAGPDDLDRALGALDKALGDDPGTCLVLLTGNVANKHHDAALTAIDRLQKATGGDPYLFHERGRILSLAKRPAEAKAAAKKATELEPGLTAAWWQLAQLALDEKAWAEVAADLTFIEVQNGVEIVDLSSVPVYADFVKSKEFAPWFAARKAAARKAIEKDPADKKGYWRLVTLSLQEKNWAETVQGLELVEAKLKVKVGKLTDVPVYAGFVKSREYAAWMEKRKK